MDRMKKAADQMRPSLRIKAQREARAKIEASRKRERRSRMTGALMTCVIAAGGFATGTAILSRPANAFLGGLGGIVLDPSNLAQNIQQVTNSIKQIAQLAEMVVKTKELLQTTQGQAELLGFGQEFEAYSSMMAEAKAIDRGFGRTKRAAANGDMWALSRELGYVAGNIEEFDQASDRLAGDTSERAKFRKGTATGDTNMTMFKSPDALGEVMRARAARFGVLRDDSPVTESQVAERRAYAEDISHLAAANARAHRESAAAGAKATETMQKWIDDAAKDSGTIKQQNVVTQQILQAVFEKLMEIHDVEAQQLDLIASDLSTRLGDEALSRQAIVDLKTRTNVKTDAGRS